MQLNNVLLIQVIKEGAKICKMIDQKQESEEIIENKNNNIENLVDTITNKMIGGFKVCIGCSDNSFIGNRIVRELNKKLDQVYNFNAKETNGFFVGDISAPMMKVVYKSSNLKISC